MDFTLNCVLDVWYQNLILFWEGLNSAWPPSALCLVSCQKANKMWKLFFFYCDQQMEIKDNWKINIAL